MGPLLFIIYFNDQYDIQYDLVTYYLYTDDLCDKYDNRTSPLFSTDVLMEWCNPNLPTLNPS